MSARKLGELLAEYVERRGAYMSSETYQQFLEQDIVSLLEQFMTAMMEMDLDSYAKACDNEYWQHPSEHGKPEQVPRRMNNTGERVKCRLMTGALYFLNGWGRNLPGQERTFSGEEELRQYITCAIVNMFTYILDESKCGTNWGTYYAWYAMQNLTWGLPNNAVEQGTCRHGEFEDVKRGKWSMRQVIHEWFKKEAETLQKLGGSEITEECKKDARADNRKSTKGARSDANTTRTVIEEHIEKKLKEGLKDILGQVKEGVKETVRELRGEGAYSANPEDDNDDGEDDDDDDADAEQEDDANAKDKEDKAASGSNADKTKKKEEKSDVQTPPQTTGGAGGAGLARAETPQDIAPPVAAPSAPPSTPAAPSSTPTSAQTPHSGAHPPAGTTTNAQTDKTTGTPGTDSKTNIGTQPNVEDKKKDADANEHGSGKGTKGADSPPEPSRQADEQGKGDNLPTDGSCSGTSHPSGENSIVPRVIQKEDTSDGSEMFHPDWDGTQFPWEKKNETGSQAPAAAASPVSGTTGQQPSDSVDPNQRQCNPSENSAGTRPCVLEISPGHIPGIDTVSGGFAPPYPEHKASSPSNTNVGTGSGGPDGPDLTADVLTATTPVLFFLTSVTVALLGYSLWQYFAYLGQPRRRAYRTVRDVPSPPLDEEILEHLQRGELPPPDYGYTMVRDTRAASAADRRGQRSPRVHTGTIIELHLEVLNECEATEWENVKDDYLQIVVHEFAQEFAQDLQQDVDTNNNILGVSTSHAALATHDSTTRAPPTDIDGIHPCPPHDPDPWSCMETIQLERDRSAPNAEDRCNRMENIQLETDTCPPHDPDPWSDDPWSCMETIPLARDRCAPNEEDPDPWNCMETIQLETGPCPPHDPDPWNCMETIQLATDTSPPNAEDPDPWSCMETIQLEHEGTHSPSPSSSDPRNANLTPDHTNWINWIDRNKHLLRQSTTQPRFLQLKAHWKQYQRQHMATNEHNGVYGHRKAATMHRKKLDAWKAWVAQQHALMHIYGDEEWFKHLLHTAQEETVPAKGEVPRVAQHLEVEQVTAAEHILRVRDVPRPQPLHQDPHTKKHFIAKLWMLLLVSVIEQCEIERSMQEKELYVHDLLEKLCN
ncbi:hypothetical protein AK88_04930 [Plasmodium fragile]|uniref:Schizont-infected cell agglutination C-terminal domain-containing protein n=1 Tax=Plasmodium fragile TaxID=5857 RepID=A0A0D9QF19_PLAFR|nr:uncharacterized protein AK88_04930 [Plasmodium fragile]KJP85427.1 hypothetical protein AK88_04930 [Plasmodium fragile]